jgi:hypothetical protein
MKHLTKILTLALTICSVTLFAQVNFGIKAGLNLANMNFKGEFSEEIEDFKKMLITFQVGGVAEFDLAESVALQTGIMLVGKGFKLEDDDFNAKATNNPMYLQVPVLILYKQGMFYIGGGPYAGFGLFGKYKEEVAGDEDSHDLEFGNGEDDDLTPLDFGLQFEAGVILDGNIRLGAGYGLGLTNALPEDNRGDDESWKHSVISINAAYMFGSGGN